MSAQTAAANVAAKSQTSRFSRMAFVAQGSTSALRLFAGLDDGKGFQPVRRARDRRLRNRQRTLLQ
jgi:hypothetical protein